MGVCGTSRTAKRSKSQRVGVPRDSGEPRGRLVFFAGLGRLRLTHVIDFTGQPFHADQVVNLFGREFRPLVLDLVLDVSERDQRVLVEVVKGVGLLGAFLRPLD